MSLIPPKPVQASFWGLNSGDFYSQTEIEAFRRGWKERVLWETTGFLKNKVKGAFLRLKSLTLILTALPSPRKLPL